MIWMALYRPAQGDPYPPVELPVPAWLKVITLAMVVIIVCVGLGLPAAKRRWKTKRDRKGHNPGAWQD